MKKFIFNLFLNRFGIVLATFNLCWFASNGFRPFVPSGDYLLFLNFPAAILTSLSVLVSGIFLPKLSFSAEMLVGNTVFAILMVFQWLFIALIAQKLAVKFQKINVR
jgi:hypothetical protein